MKYYPFFLLVLLIFSSCDTASDPHEINGIVFGDNIEGVRIFDDSAAVVRKLGKPTSIGYGDFRGYIFDYTKGVLNYTHLIIMEDPLLAYGVVSMSVEAPYRGRSKEGIKIGSEREFVIDRLGTPERTQGEPPDNIDLYKYRTNYFSIDYESNKVKRITMLVFLN